MLLALRIVEEGFVDADLDAFGAEPDEVMNFAMKQLQVRMDVLSRAKGKKLEEIYSASNHDFSLI